MAIRLVVTGGRKYNNYQLVHAWVKFIHDSEGVSVMINGKASGADHLAELAANALGIPVLPFPALWKVHGPKAAGPIRNQEMIDEGRPDLLLSFPGHNGTADMTRKCVAAGLRVIVTGNEMPKEGVDYG